MTDLETIGADFLEHYGAKGMKWGVRKDKGKVGSLARNAKIKRLDKKFERQINDPKTYQRIGMQAGRNYQKTDMKRINSKGMYRGKNLNNDTLLRNKYHQEHEQAMLKHLDRVVAQQGTNASGTRKLKIIEAADKGRWILITTNASKADVRHADEDFEETVMSFKLVYDDNGFIVAIEPEDNTMTQYTMDGEEFLEHFGKKGMKWGVRKSASSGGSSGKTDGRAGNKPPMNPHQKRQAEAAGKDVKRGKDKTQYKKAPNRLTESELKARIGRMELEKKYNELNAEPPSKGKKMVDDVLQNSGKQIATTVLVGAGLLVTKKIIEKKFGAETASAITGKGKDKKKDSGQLKLF